MKKTILHILSCIDACLQADTEQATFRNGVFILQNGDILATQRSVGDSRYPYDMDGRVLWAHSNGHLDCNEGDLQIFRAAMPGELPCVAFWGGIRSGTGWTPVSITGATALPDEADSIRRYTVFAKRAAYYLVDTQNVVFALRVCVTSAKKLCFTASAINKGDATAERYLACFMDPLLRRTQTDTAWRPIARVGTLVQRGAFKISRAPDPEDTDGLNIAVINRTIEAVFAYTEKASVALTTFLGGAGRTISNAKTLYTGAYPREAKSVNTTDVAIASHLVRFSLPPNGEMEIHYTVDVCHDETTANRSLGTVISSEEIENELRIQTEAETAQMAELRIQFGNLTQDSTARQKMLA